MKNYQEIKKAKNNFNSRKKANSDFNGDTEAEIADQRYKFISEVVNKTVSKPLKANGQRKETTSDKIDKVLTNRIIAIPAF